MCAIGEEMSLDNIIAESFEWLDNLRRNCVENGWNICKVNISKW